ncbi:hypothetical protein [Aureivirga sp. CE67]|uniref:hypothetical protein n=1 Tax=Aureivirga sp. CE67 TaxID=1788983 RepID=UPI0018CA19E5|nr:hypothetical protein [Aureivirga sp. CE67]
MKRILKYTLLSIFLTTNIAIGQVSEIKEKVDIQAELDNEKSGSSSSKSSRSSGTTVGESIIAEFFAEILYGIGYVTVLAVDAGQEHTLDQKHLHPEYVSLEINTPLAYGFPNDYFLTQPKIQGNWGIFASEFRYSYLKDNTGDLATLDWQILKVKLPIKGFQPFFGIGFSYLFSPEETYFEYSTGFDWRMSQQKVNWSCVYRRATDNDATFRQELEMKVDYLVYKKDNFHIYPQIGVNYQNYFETIDVTSFNLGMTFRFQ